MVASGSISPGNREKPSDESMACNIIFDIFATAPIARIKHYSN
jgi:hypothetical protein